MAPQSMLEWLMYWRNKQPNDNLWHPIPGMDTRGSSIHISSSFRHPDIEATTVDAAPVVLGVGAITHLRQLNDFGLTASASVFKNPRTMLAMTYAANLVPIPILLMQMFGFGYRQYMPRWASDQEIRRDEQEARRHITFGIGAGLVVMGVRMYFRKGGLSLLDGLIGGALADVMHREYRRAHGL